MPEEPAQSAEADQAVAAPEAPPTSTQRQTKPREAAKPNPKPPPRHAVILHNDPHNTFEFVIDTLVKILKIETGQAIRFTLTAHRTGKCAVWTGPKEHAEMKAAQITGQGPDPYAVMSLGGAATPLKTTIEPVPGT
ncbi:MAG: ATP-dependent Clp protease adaptor ClpS [Planctomycetota bacterium]